jgi:hypothetical protein
MSASNPTSASSVPSRRQYWRPPGDEELTWFRPPAGIITDRPRPLEATLTVPAFGFGLTHSLISLYFPLSEVRARVIDGQVYVAPVPSPLADRDLTAQLRRARDSSLRFTRNLRGAWERSGREEAEGYNAALTAFAPADATDADVAESMSTLRRDRGNQWFIAVRMGVATPVMLRYRGDAVPEDDARAVLAEVREIVVQQGTAELDRALLRTGERLVRRGVLAEAEDVHWLEMEEVRSALQDGGDQRALVEARRATATEPARENAREVIGPTLPADTPRMLLLRQILNLLAGGDA